MSRLETAQKQYGGGCGIYIKSQRKPQNRISDFHKIIDKYLLHISELYIAGKQMINAKFTDEKQRWVGI